MAELWYPKAVRDPGNSAGDYTDLGEPKGLLHTTEGKSYASARSAFVANNSWPHATCSYETGQFQIWQHNPIDVASRALRNLAGGVETNRDNVVQLEIVGTADRGNATSWGDQYVENFPAGYLDGIGDWMAWVNENRGVPNRCTVTFKTYPESYGTDNGVRLTGDQWDAYTGWLGHMHAPENLHGDPGLIDIAYLLARAAPAPPPVHLPKDDEMLLIRPAGSTTRYLLIDGKLVYLPTSTDVTQLAETGIGVWDISSEQLAVLRSAFPTVAN